MRRKTACFFADLDVSALHGFLVVLDVDGTLGPHGCDELTPEVLRQISTLVRNGNLVRLVSNNTDSVRTRRLAVCLGVEMAESTYRKPDIRALGDIPELLRGWPVVVIGDKVLVDGLFAKRLGATFCKVASIRSPNDPRMVRVHYALDCVAGRFFRC